MKGDGWVLSNQNDTHASLMLLYCLKVHIGEEEVNHWQNFVYYFMDSLLQTLSHIRMRLIKSSFESLLYKALWIIFNCSLWTKNMWKSKIRVTSYKFRYTIYKFKRVTSSNPWVTSSNLQVTSSILQITSSNPRVTSSNSWVTSSNSWVTSSNPRV